MATFQLIKPSVLQAKSLAEDGQPVISVHQLDEILGNHDGRFSTSGQNFSHSAREVTLLGSRMSAQLCRADATWINASVEFRVEQQHVSGNWTHQLSVHSPGSSFMKDGRNLRLEGTLYLLQDFLVESGPNANDRVLITHTLDLDSRLGNCNGRFDVLGQFFSASARNIRLLDTVLHAELETMTGEWEEDQIDLRWMTEVWRLADVNPSIQVPALTSERSRLISSESTRLYAPLPPGKEYIRVCYIKPGLKDADIECSMMSRPLDLKETYKCLSYVWGSVQDKQKIRVNSKVVYVTKNLFNALKGLRSLGVNKAIWIDSICINQADDAEKSTQVALMAKVYGRAQQVIIWLDWLGPVPNTPSFTPRIPSKISSILLSRFALAMDRDLHVSDAIDEAFRPFLGKYKFDLDRVGALASVINALQQFVSTAWFQRVWTLQEYVFAGDAVYVFSNEILGTETFKHAVQNWDRHTNSCCPLHKVGLDSGVTTDSIGKHRESLNINRAINAGNVYFHEEFNLLEQVKDVSRLASTHAVPSTVTPLMLDYGLMLLYRARKNKSSDPRDRIFAFANIATSLFGTFKPDYSMAVDQVFANFTLRLIQQMGNFDVWFLAKMPDETAMTKLLNLPSWAIDWTQNYEPIVLNRFWERQKTAGPVLTCCHGKNLLRHDDKNNIRVFARSFDKIRSISIDKAKNQQRTSGPRAAILAGPEIIPSWMQFVGIESLNDVPKQLSKWNQLWRTLLMDQFPLHPSDALPGPDDLENWQSLTSEYDEVLKNLAAKAQKWQSSLIESEFSHPEHIVGSAIATNVNGRKIFSTAEGYLGLCPAQALPGDVIFYVAGSRLPVLLRPCVIPSEHGQSAFSYKLVGTCFVQGVTDHEVRTLLEQGHSVNIC